MDNEKELLKQDLAKQETKKDIEAFIEDTEIMGGHEDIVALAKAKLEAIDAKVVEVNTPVPSAETTNIKVEAMNGSAEVVQEKTAEVDEKLKENAEEITEIKAESEKEIGEVKGEKVKEIQSSTTEKINTGPEGEAEKELNNLLEKIKSDLPNKFKEIYNSEYYKNLLDLNEKRKVEDKVLYEAYEKYTKDGDGSHKRSFYLGSFGENTKQYIDDLKFFKAPADLIKRFEEYKIKFKDPEKNAESNFENKQMIKINQERWDFERIVMGKSKELFINDRLGSIKANEFERNFFNAYSSILDKARYDTIPDKKENINTMGTIYS